MKELKVPVDKTTLTKYLTEYPKVNNFRLTRQGKYTCFKYNKRRLTGLTNFLNDKIYPDVKFRKRVTTKGYSSRSKGKRIHKVINQLITERRIPTSVTIKEQKIFQQLLHDLSILKLEPIGSEVIVTSGGCATAIDLLCCRKKKWTDLVVVEMKTGYCEGLDTEYKADGQMILPAGMEMKNTSKNRHLLQAFYSSIMFNDMYKKNIFNVKKSCVVYLDENERDGQIKDNLHFSWFTNVLDSINKKTADELLEKLEN